MTLRDRLSRVSAVVADHKRVCEAATPGPWISELEDCTVWTVGDRYGSADGGMLVADIRGWGYLTGRFGCAMGEERAVKIQEANAALIVDARNWWLRYIAAAEEELEFAIGLATAATICCDWIDEAEAIVLRWEKALGISAEEGL